MKNVTTSVLEKLAKVSVPWVSVKNIFHLLFVKQIFSSKFDMVSLPYKTYKRF